MEIVKPREKEVPKFFLTKCQKMGNCCGAELKVYPEDCFQCPYATSWTDDTPMGGGRWLSFYCESCGLIITPDYDFAEASMWVGLEDRAKELGLYFKTKDNVPPWSAHNFPTFKEFNAKHNIQWGIR